MTTVADHAYWLAVFLMVVYSFHRGRLVRSGVRTTVSPVRTYCRLAAVAAASLLAVLAIWAGTGRASTLLGLGFEPSTGYAVAGGLSVVILLALASRRLTRAHGSVWARLAPRTKRERRTFQLTMLLITFNEEIVFRAFLTWYLQASPFFQAGLVAYFVTPFIFALCHAADGRAATRTAFALGFLNSVLFLLSGGIWLATLVHYVHNVQWAARYPVDLQGATDSRPG